MQIIRRRVHRPLEDPARVRPIQKCHRGIIEIIALLRPNILTKQEERGRCVGQEGGCQKNAGERSEKNKHQTLEEELNDRKATERKMAAGKTGEETSESHTPIEEKKDGSGRLHFLNPTTCHVPGGSSTFWPHRHIEMGRGKEEKGKEEAGRKYNINLSAKQGEYL
ncbi:hypothetical protein NDU88_005008 [Pleurodeles waltl]|uniref:Uncharacterized protein n=1 Tax=Pleurodeles waltl TaxID=8319 RepID=A0AAV7WC49_PLEWA|nr:hypothetical protein NDU88_005008 [Pleurodeles waltl]